MSVSVLDAGKASHGAERRRFARYQLVMPVAGFIEHDYERLSGRVIDVSAGGFRLFLPGFVGKDYKLPGLLDFGEIAVQGRLVGGFGKLVFMNPVANGTSAGFHWDDYVVEDNKSFLMTVINELNEQKNMGHVSICGDRIVVCGHVSSAMSCDMFGAINRGVKRICLRECSSIDSGGLDLLICMQESGMFVEACSHEVRDILDRFHVRLVA